MMSWAEEAADGKGGVQGLRKEHGGLRLPSHSPLKGKQRKSLLAARVYFLEAVRLRVL